MGVCLKEVRTLSLSSNDEMYYKKKACVGDCVTLFLNSGEQITGVVYKLSNNYISLSHPASNKIIKSVKYSNVRTFNINSRGNVCHNYFW